MEDLNERNLTRTARRKMAQRAKRTAKKRAVKRKMRAKRMKNPIQLKQSAEKLAKNLIVKKLTGGKKYGELSIGQKEMVDKKIAAKKGLVKKVARKMLPRVKAKEKARLKAARAKGKEGKEGKSESVNEVADPLTIASVVAITGGAVAITATLAKKLHIVFFGRRVDFNVKKTYELIKKKYPGIFSDISHQRLGRGKLANFFRKIEDEIPGLKKKSFMDNITSIIDQLMKHHNWATVGDQSGKLDPERFQRESVNEYVGPKYKTANEIKKHWKKEYPNAEFTFKKVRAKGNDWLLVLSPKGVELERYQHVPKTGWIEMNENKDNEEDIKSLQAILDVASDLSPKSPYFKGRGSKDKYIKMIQHKLSKLGVHENINVPISIGDTVLGGKFKNKKIVVKSIGKNEKGDLTINGKPLLKYRVIRQKGQMFKEGSKKNKNKPTTRMDAYKKVRKTTMPKSRPMKSKKTYDRKKLRKGEDD
jgi:hypothetical protein